MDNEKTTDDVKISDTMMWQEAEKVVADGVIFECTFLMENIFIPLASDWNDNRLFDEDDLYKNCCPDCGSCNISENDEDEDEDEDEEETGEYICDDCGHKFDDPGIVEPLEYWFVESWLASRLENEGELIIRTCCTPDIWARCTSGQQIKCDGVIWNIARADLKSRLEWERKNK